MQITATTVSLTVDDVARSSAFLVDHFGFTSLMADEGGNVASVGRDDCGVTVIFVRRGCEVLPASYRDVGAAGVILAFTVNGLEGEADRLRAEGVPISLPLREEPWGERLFQVTDPNGVIVQLVEWAESGGGPWPGSAGEPAGA